MWAIASSARDLPEPRSRFIEANSRGLAPSVENSSDKHAVIPPEVAIASDDLNQIRMRDIPI
jgi:hypothetical protein